MEDNEHEYAKLLRRLEKIPTNGAPGLISGRHIDISVAISLKRIADNLDGMSEQLDAIMQIVRMKP